MSGAGGAWGWGHEGVQGGGHGCGQAVAGGAGAPWVLDPRQLPGVCLPCRITDMSKVSMSSRPEPGYENMDHFSINVDYVAEMLRTIEFQTGAGTGTSAAVPGGMGAWDCLRCPALGQAEPPSASCPGWGCVPSSTGMGMCGHSVLPGDPVGVRPALCSLWLMGCCVPHQGRHPTLGWSCLSHGVSPGCPRRGRDGPG